jgi:7-cyano-7-deazaguanine synthase
VNEKALIVLSGGLDSTTLLHHMKCAGYTLGAISFDYGQKHAKELEFARYWAGTFGLPHEIVKLDNVFAGSALTNDKPMPLSDYSVDSMKTTVVPNRNMVMLAIAVSKAIQGGYTTVAYGAHAGDREVYPDCRPAFVNTMRRAAQLCDWTPVKLMAPFLDLTKREIAVLAADLGVDLSHTWSCYEGGEEPCGQCGSCRSRNEAVA